MRGEFGLVAGADLFIRVRRADGICAIARNPSDLVIVGQIGKRLINILDRRRLVIRISPHGKRLDADKAHAYLDNLQMSAPGEIGTAGDDFIANANLRRDMRPCAGNHDVGRLEIHRHFQMKRRDRIRLVLHGGVGRDFLDGHGCLMMMERFRGEHEARPNDRKGERQPRDRKAARLLR